MARSYTYNQPGAVVGKRVKDGTPGKFLIVGADGNLAESEGGGAIGTTVTDGTSGSILFVDASGNLAQDNANLFWDNTTKQLKLSGGTAGSVHNLVIDRDFAGVDPKIQLINDENGQYGNAIEGYKVDAVGTRQPAGRIIFERWTGGANFGQIRLQVGSFGTWGSAATLDANGLFTATSIVGRPTISAQDSAGGDAVALHSATGATPPGTGALRHGIWGQDHLNANFRGGGNDVMVISWEQKVGIGYAVATTPAIAGKFNVKTHSTTIPTAVLDELTSQTAAFLELRNTSGTPITYFEVDGELVIAQDSKAIKFGAGVDATILYDGTNLVINPKLVGTGYVDVTDKLRTAGELEVDGDLNHDGTNVGFYGTAPIAKPTTAIAEATFVENAGGTAVNVDSTFGGYTLQQVVQALQNFGLLT